MKAKLNIKMTRCPQCGSGVRRHNEPIMRFPNKETSDAYNNAKDHADSIMGKLKTARVAPELIETNEELSNAREEVRRLEKTKTGRSALVCHRCGFVEADYTSYPCYGRLVVVWPGGHQDNVTLFYWHELKAWEKWLSNPTVAYAKLSHHLKHDGEPLFIQLIAWDLDTWSPKVLVNLERDSEPLNVQLPTCKSHYIPMESDMRMAAGLLCQNLEVKQEDAQC